GGTTQPHEARAGELERLLPLIKQHAEAGQGLLSTQGIHFALPMDFVLDVARHLREGVAMPRGRLGVRVAAMDPMVAHLLGADGVLVEEVAEGGPAAEGGLRTGDVIVGFGGLPVTAPGALRRLVLVGGGSPVGSPVAVEIIRGAERLNLMVTLELLPDAAGSGGSDDESR
ncbi:MAG: PDZ domain-containing protein, partial [Planctomycetes bacterium]|nr:PDZ domain-containing protein [Planctomycetota bacterium]